MSLRDYASQNPWNKDDFEKDKEPINNNILWLQTNQKDRNEQTLKILQTYQSNIKKSESLLTDILKGIKNGNNVYDLFLKASKAISLMTDDKVFYDQVEADINAVHGVGLKQKIPLKKLLSDAKMRLKLLEEAEEKELDEDTKKRIDNAIKAHKQHIAGLKEC